MFQEVETFLEDNGLELYEAKIDALPDTNIDMTDFDTALKFTKMLQAFEEDEDVNTLSSNEIITPELQKEVDEYIAERSFHT